MNAPFIETPPDAAATKLAALGALSLFLSTIEYMIPKPLPFIRLGIANAPLLIALNFPFPSFLMLVFVKIFGQALVSGTLFSYVFLLSASGTLISAAAMFFLRRLACEKYLSLTGISIAGALLSNVTQITLARFFILGPAAVYIMPPFIAMGIASGTALGMFCQRFKEKSRWYRGERVAPAVSAETAGLKAANRKPLLDTTTFPPRVLFFAGLFMSALMLFTRDPLLRLLLFFIFWLTAIAAGKSGSIFYTVVFFVVIAAFNMLVPYGRVIYEIGAFRLTEGALLQGIEKAATVEGLVMLSRVTISPRFGLPGRAGALLSEAFLLLPRLLEKKKSIHAKTFIEDVDRALLELSAAR
jgi:heptaprenyl diphosphate synthase